MITKKRLQKLAGIITEQMYPMASPGTFANPFGKDLPDDKSEYESAAPSDQLSLADERPVWSDEDKQKLVEYVAHLRALHLWFHGAHHVSKGESFGGDHADIYQRIYTEVEQEVDGAIEKIVGVTNDDMLACPLKITKKSLALMEQCGCPPDMNPTELAKAGLAFEKSYIKFIEELFKDLESKNLLTLGLNDQLAASANAHEVYVYLLQQRVKTKETMPESKNSNGQILSGHWFDVIDIG